MHTQLNFILKAFFVFVLIFVLNDSIASNANISIAPIGAVRYSKTLTDTGVLSYQFKVTNRLSAAIANGLFLNTLTLSNAGLGAEFNLKSTTCPFGSSTDYLKPNGQTGDSCEITYQSIIPNALGKYFTHFKISDALGGNTTSSDFGVSVAEVAVAGMITSPLPTITAKDTNYLVSFKFVNHSKLLPATGVKIIKNLPNFTESSDDCGKTIVANSSCIISGYFKSSTFSAATLSVTLSYNEGEPISLTTNTTTTLLATKYHNEIVSLGTAGPIQWISANYPNGFSSYPKSYPSIVSNVTDVMPSSNVYTIALNGGPSLQIIKDGTIGNAFHFTGNQSLYTSSSTINTNFTIIALMRKPTSNAGRLLTGFVTGTTNALLGYWDASQDTWYIENGGKLDVALTTNANLYIFSNNNGTKTMYKYPVQGTTETVVQPATTTGGNSWGRVVYGRPLAFSNEAATNAYIYDVMVFNRVLTPTERAQIVAFYQSVYPYWT